MNKDADPGIVGSSKKPANGKTMKCFVVVSNGAIGPASQEDL